MRRLPVVKRCLLDITGLLHSELTAAVAPCIRPVEDQSSPNPSPEWGELPCHELPPLSEALLATDGCWRRFRFLQRYGTGGSVHVLVDGPPPTYMQAGLRELNGFLKRAH